MKLTAQELNIIIDTLSGSIQINDPDLAVFKYPTMTRQNLAHELILRADQIWIGVDTDEP